MNVEVKSLLKWVKPFNSVSLLLVASTQKNLARFKHSFLFVQKCARNVFFALVLKIKNRRLVRLHTKHSLLELMHWFEKLKELALRRLSHILKNVSNFHQIILRFMNLTSFRARFNFFKSTYFPSPILATASTSCVLEHDHSPLSASLSMSQNFDPSGSPSSDAVVAIPVSSKKSTQNAFSEEALEKREIPITDKNGFGSHLMLDFKGCPLNKLNNLELCFAALNDLPGLISMTKISAPHVFRYDAQKQNESGITGVVIIAESHISLHTFPEKEYMFVDVFSCRSFNEEAVLQYFQEVFQPSLVHKFRQDRGKDFPRD